MPGFHSARYVQETKARWHILHSLFFIFILVLAIFFFLQSSFFRVKNIEVTGLKQLKKEQVVALSGLAPGVNIFRADLRQAQSKIALNPMVGDVQITRKLPRTILVNITERKPLAIIPDKGSFIIVGDGGYVLARVKNLSSVNLPMLTGLKTAGANPGKIIADEKIQIALKYLLTMSLNLRAAVSEINLTDVNNIRIYTIDGVEVRFGDDTRIADKIKLYGEVIGQNYKNKILYIDISYKGSPVIKFMGQEGETKKEP